MSTNVATFEEIVETVQHWPASQRFSLAQILFQSLEPELKQVEHRKKNTLSKALGLLETSTQAPTDDQVEEWLDERRVEKYG